MPKATMDEYGYPLLYENEVWFTRQIFTVESEAKTQRVGLLSHPNLWGGILGRDPRHKPRSAFRR
jgi:hypothetical protein